MTRSFLALGAILALTGIGAAHAVQVPGSGAIYTAIEWGPLDSDGNVLRTPLGTISASAAGSVSTSASDPKLDGQGSIFGQDTLGLRFGFNVTQIAFNYVAGDIPSQVRFGDRSYYLPAGTSTTLDYRSAAGFNDIYFSALGHGIDNVFNVGTLYVSDSDQPIFDTGFTVLQTVPEPATAALVLLGVIAAGVSRRRQT